MPKLTKVQIESLMAEAAKQVPVGSKWVHYKKPDLNHIYEIVLLAFGITGNEEVVVVYKPLYVDVAQVPFERTLKEFTEVVETENGSVLRFQPFENYD